MLSVNIITPDKMLFSGVVKSVRFPGASGSFMVLKHHAPIISSLMKGEIVCKDAEGAHIFPISSGFVKVENNVVSVCVEL